MPYFHGLRVLRASNRDQNSSVFFLSIFLIESPYILSLLLSVLSKRLFEVRSTNTPGPECHRNGPRLSPLRLGLETWHRYMMA